jgi:hypothetical protein
MLVRSDFPQIVLDTVIGLGGEATVVEVAKAIWTKHERDLKASGDLFFTWQYDMRWAAQSLRDDGKLTRSGKKWAVK